MTREILKFRAWNPVEEKFTYWTMNDLCLWEDKDEKPSPFDEWQQYTGLKDKNGKDIYEGDIFMDEEDGTCESVEWDSEFGGWSTQMWYSVGEFAQNASYLEVIGNIYQNPELLKSND